MELVEGDLALAAVQDQPPQLRLHLRGAGAGAGATTSLAVRRRRPPRGSEPQPHADADAQGRHQQVPLLHPSRNRRETLSRIPDRESSAAVELEGGQDDEREMPSGDVGEMK